MKPAVHRHIRARDPLAPDGLDALIHTHHPPHAIAFGSFNVYGGLLQLLLLLLRQSSGLTVLTFACWQGRQGW